MSIRHALIFAAGRGTRMRPLTDHTAKPLLRFGHRCLIEHHLEKLATAGVETVVINVSHFADQFEPALGDGRRWNLRIHYSDEGPEPLETGGGMRRALPWLGSAPFIAVSADIVSDFDYASLPTQPDGLAHLVMVPNPDFHAGGDFGLENHRLIPAQAGHSLTFGNIGVYRPELVAGQPDGGFKLRPLFDCAIARGELGGECYTGFWRNIGTPEQLAELSALHAASEAARKSPVDSV